MLLKIKRSWWIPISNFEGGKAMRNNQYYRNGARRKKSEKKKKKIERIYGDVGMKAMKSLAYADSLARR
jgi:hypothetical protein